MQSAHVCQPIKNPPTRYIKCASMDTQFDSFLGHFKRSASKAMDTDWNNTGMVADSPRSANRFYHPSSIRNRSSCIDISQLGASLGNNGLPHRKNRALSKWFRSSIDSMMVSFRRILSYANNHTMIEPHGILFKTNLVE